MTDLNKYTRNLIIIVSISILCMLVYSMAFGWDNFLKVSSIGILLSIASFAVGSTLGFIFGLPTFKDGNSEIMYERNTSLKEIADWITKIIIGITLVELKSIISSFQDLVISIGEYLAVGETGQIYASVLIIQYFFIGFVSIYLLTITDVFKYLANNDKLIQGILERSGGVEGDNAKVADLINKETGLSEKEKSKILEYVKSNGSKIDDLYLIKRLAKVLFGMKEYYYSAEFYKRVYVLDSSDVYAKINEAYIRSKFLKETSISNNMLRELIGKYPDMAILYYNLACNYNREYKEIKETSTNEEYKKKLFEEVNKNIELALRKDEGLLSEALSDSELTGIKINEIFNRIYSNNP